MNVSLLVTKAKSCFPIKCKQTFKAFYITGAVIISSLSFLACNLKAKSSEIYGEYKAFSKDPSIGRFLAGEGTHLLIKKDQTIEYNSTMNGKPKFHFVGSYTLDEQTNTLKIKWKEGKIPSTLVIEKEKNNQIIKIGKTYYVKEMKVD